MPLEGKLGWVVCPGVEDGCPTVCHMRDVSGREVEVVLQRRGGEKCIDHRGRVARKTLDFAADGSPSQRDRVRDRKNPRGEAGFECSDRAFDPGAKLISLGKVMKSLLVLGDGENAQEKRLLRLRNNPTCYARVGLYAA